MNFSCINRIAQCRTTEQPDYMTMQGWVRPLATETNFDEFVCYRWVTKGALLKPISLHMAAMHSELAYMWPHDYSHAVVTLASSPDPHLYPIR